MNLSIITAPLIVAGISTFLAGLIAIIDSIVNNYGTVSININKGKKELKTKGGNTLLSSLAENKIFIPSACGGRGSCGVCKVKAVSDIGPVFPTELPFLTAPEKTDGTRLSCQIKLKTDIEIDIPEELFNIKEFRGSISSIKDLTHDIKEILIKLEEPESIDFKSGQYVQLEVPPYEKIKSSTQRAYSMSSKPSDKDKVELIIRLVPNGIVTTYVHKLLRENESVKIIGPIGDFFVRETNADMICVAGGSGMAPIKSILYDLFEKSENKRDIWYFFGARSLKDLFYIDELTELDKKWKNFHFIPALSEPDPEDKWKGETGLITEVLDKFLKQKISKNTDKEGYLCGSPGMIDACINVMKENNIPNDKIYFDNFA
jgi:Na+-transporting NADH:ubiquinone oxidoreductase subunit F